MDKRSIPPKTAVVRQMASLLAAQYPKSQPVSKEWVSEFIKHYNDLQSKWNCKYNYQRAKCEDLVFI